jgi:hypothetical protein
MMQTKFKDASPTLRRQIIKILARLVAEGKAEYTTIGGQPAVRLLGDKHDKASKMDKGPKS